MNTVAKVGTFKLGSRAVRRIGYGAMQLAGPGVFGPPKDRSAAIAVLREAVARGVDHIDTSDAYGPHITNRLLREALHPYPDNLVIATKVGAVRGPNGTWDPAYSAADIMQQVDDNLRNLGIERLEVVNLRVMFDPMRPVEGSIEAPLTALMNLKRAGKIAHIGLSNVTATQVMEGCRLTDIVCVQNMYNLAHRQDDPMIDDLASKGIAYVPFFPLGGFSPLQSEVLSEIAGRLHVTPMQLAAAWLLRRSPNILLIAGTSSIQHLRENLAAGDLELSPEVMAELESVRNGR